MKKRIFIALNIPDQLKPEIALFQKSYSHLPVRWIKPQNLHITLVPPWHSESASWRKEINPSRPRREPRSEEKIRPLGAQFRPINVHFDRVAFGPNPKKPRLIWAIGQAVPQITNLQKKLQKTLGRPEEKREYLLHLTLARFNPRDFRKFPIKQIREKISWSDKIDSFSLLESCPTTTGAEYEIIKKIKLGRANTP